MDTRTCNNRRHLEKAAAPVRSPLALIFVVTIKIKNISADDIDAWVHKVGQKSTFRLLPTNSILSVRRTSSKIKIDGMLMSADGHLSDSASDLEITVRIRTTFKLAFFLGLVFILFFLFAAQVTLNGNPDPTVLERLVFVSVGLALWTFIFIPLLGYRRDFGEKIKTSLSKN